MPDEFKPPTTVKPSGTIDTQPKEPPKEVLTQTFSLDPSLMSGDTTRVVTEDNKGEVKKVETTTPEVAEVKKEETKVEDKPRDEDGKFIPKVEEKKDEVKPTEEKKPTQTSILKPPQEKKQEVVGEKKEVVKQITLPIKGDKVERDYSGFSNEEVSMLKQMSNEAFTYTSKVLKEHKEATKAKNDIFLQHPDAHTLSPEFRQIQQDIYFLSKEAQEWSNALAKCVKGEKFKDINGFDQQGNVVYGAEIEPSSQVEELVRAKFNQCLTSVENNKGKLQQTAVQFKDRAQKDIEVINNERKQRFAWVADPKLLDYTLEIQGVGPTSIKDIRNYMINLLPPYMRNSVASELCADLFVALRVQGEELTQAQNSVKVADTKREEVLRGEPTSEVRKEPEPPIVGGKVREFSLSGIPD